MGVCRSNRNYAVNSDKYADAIHNIDAYSNVNTDFDGYVRNNFHANFHTNFHTNIDTNGNANTDL
jgi:hypothetical protein